MSSSCCLSTRIFHPLRREKMRDLKGWPFEPLGDAIPMRILQDFIISFGGSSSSGQGSTGTEVFTPAAVKIISSKPPVGAWKLTYTEITRPKFITIHSSIFHLFDEST